MITLLLAIFEVSAEPPHPGKNPEVGSLPDVIAPPEPGQDAGPMFVDARVPVEIMVDGAKLAQLWYPGTARFDVLAGRHVLRLYVDGQPQDVTIEIHAGRETQVLVGRTGVSVTEGPTVATPDVNAVDVEIRVVGGGAAQVRIDAERHRLSGGDRLNLSLAPGPHAMSVRSQDGTAIWAAGTLSLAGGAPVVVQIAEGRMPEVGGPARFDPGGG
jgi:hypothetical protein